MESARQFQILAETICVHFALISKKKFKSIYSFPVIGKIVRQTENSSLGCQSVYKDYTEFKTRWLRMELAYPNMQKKLWC